MITSLLKKLILFLFFVLFFPKTVLAESAYFSNPSIPWASQIENSTFTFTATVTDSVIGRTYKVGYSHPGDSTTSPAHLMLNFPTSTGGPISVSPSFGPLSPTGTYYIFIYYISGSNIVLISAPLIVGSAPTPTPTSTLIPTPTPTAAPCVSNVILLGGWDDYGMGAQTNIPVTLRVNNPLTGVQYQWSFDSGATWSSGSTQKEITKTFASPGDFTVSSRYYWPGNDPNITSVSCSTTSNIASPAQVHVYNACTGGSFSNGANITSSNGSIVDTCAIPSAGGCVGGSSYTVSYNGIGQWGYFGAGSGITGSASMRSISGSGSQVAGPDFAAYIPTFGTLNQNYGFGSTCFRAQSNAGQSVNLGIGAGTIYCRPATSGSCAGGGSGGPHEPFMTDIFGPVNCGYQAFGYACQIEARASFGTAGTFRFGNFKGGTITQVGNDTCANLAGGTFLELADYMAFRSASFVPTKSGTLDSINLRINRIGGGLSWVDIKITNEDWCWSDSCFIPPALTGLNGQKAEAGAEINQTTTFDGWLTFSFAGSQPELLTGHQYKIYAQSSTGQSGAANKPGWYSRTGTGSCSGTRFGFYAYIRENKETPGIFLESSLPGSNPLPDQCNLTSPCVRWWLPSGSGTYTISADLLVTNPSNAYPSNPDKVGNKTTTKYLSYTINVPTPTPTPTPEVLPWFQVQGGDVHAEGNITSLIPATAVNKAFNLDLDGYPGVVSFTGSVNFSPANVVSSTGWLVKNTNLNPFSYASYYLKFGSPTIDNFVCSPQCPTASGVYYSDSTHNAIIDKNWTLPSNTKIIVLVDQELNIQKEISVPVGSFLAFFVKGNIDIEGQVGDQGSVVKTGINANLQGVFYTDGTIDTYSNKGTGLGSGNRFVGAGSFFASHINLKRDLKGGALSNSTNPAELFISRPDFIINAPSTLFSSSFSWQEVAP